MPGKAKTLSKGSDANIEDGEWVERLSLILDEFRKVSQDITANQMLVLLRIGERPDITQKELSQLVQLPIGTVSRICAIMSRHGHQNRPGLNLAESRPLPKDDRTKGQCLIGNGLRLYNSIRRLMAQR